MLGAWSYLFLETLGGIPSNTIQPIIQAMGFSMQAMRRPSVDALA